MQPWVEFDVENDVPKQLVLRCLALWRPRFTTEVDTSHVNNILFDSGVDDDQSKTNRTTNEQREQQRSDDSSKDSDNWCTFEQELYPQRTKPEKLEIDDSPRETVTNWLAAIHKVVAWLADEGRLSASDCPIGTGVYTFIGTEKVNPNGTPFRRPQTLSNGLILQRGYVNTIAQWQKLRQLLGELGVDRSTIRGLIDRQAKPIAK